MTRSQRFPFHLPSRKPSARVPPPNILEGNTTEPVDARMENRNSKAYKILGTSDTSSVTTSKSKGWRMKKNVTNKSSFISVTVSEVSEGKAGGRIKQSVRGTEHNDNQSGRVRMLDRDLNERPSSLLLGERYQNASNVSDASSDVRGRLLHQVDSTSSLHSFYDPAKSPLAISQQTSESSARDYALRKGCPPVTGFHAHPAIQDPHDEPRKPKKALQSKLFRRRPPRIDLSTLFPKPRVSSGALLSPQRLTDSPSPISEASVDPFQRLKPKHSRSSTHTTNLSITQTRAAPEPILQYRTQHSRVPERMPKPTPAMKHWFDQEVLSDDEIPDDTQSLAVSKPVLEQLENRHLRNISEDTIKPHSPPPSLPTPATSLHSNKGRSPAIARSSQLQATLLSSEDTKSNLSLASRRSTTSRKTSGSAMASADLTEESVLCLSFSSDEEEQESAFAFPTISALNKNRDSVATSAYESDTVQICTAEAVSSARSRSSKIHPHSPKSTSKTKRVIPQRSSSVAASATLSVPSSRNQRVTSSPHSSAFKSMDSQKMSSTPSNLSRDEKYLSCRLPATTYKPPSIPQPSKAKNSPRQSRIMTVTKEEESLLEAMRQKRAAMRQSLFQEGYMAASTCTQEIPIHLDLNRPRTSHNESQSSFLRLSDDRASVSSSRPRTSHEHRASLQAGDFVFPDPPLPSTILNGKTGRRPSRQGSIKSTYGSLGFGHSQSDAVPSPSTSRASPLTPTTAHSAQVATERFSKELSIPSSASPSDELLDRRHSRTRTVSSGVIVLEGVESDVGIRERTGVLVDEGWPIWAMRGWHGGEDVENIL
jgi:hypothetical protein